MRYEVRYLRDFKEEKVMCLSRSSLIDDSVELDNEGLGGLICAEICHREGLNPSRVAINSVTEVGVKDDY